MTINEGPSRTRAGAAPASAEAGHEQVLQQRSATETAERQQHRTDHGLLRIRAERPFAQLFDSAQEQLQLARKLSAILQASSLGNLIAEPSPRGLARRLRRPPQHYRGGGDDQHAYPYRDQIGDAWVVIGEQAAARDDDQRDDQKRPIQQGGDAFGALGEKDEGKPIVETALLTSGPSAWLMLESKPIAVFLECLGRPNDAAAMKSPCEPPGQKRRVRNKKDQE